MRGVRSWQPFEIRRIEDLSDAVLGANLEVIQMAGAPIRGSLAFAVRNGVVFSSGLIEGHVAIRGPLSKDSLTVGIGLKLGPGSRQWLNTANDGEISLVMPGDRHDVIYAEGSLYMTATLSAQRLKEQAAREGFILRPAMMGRTGTHARPLATRIRGRLLDQVMEIHTGGVASNGSSNEIGRTMLRTVIEHYVQYPAAKTRNRPLGRTLVVANARDYIVANLARAITLESLADATTTSRRTLIRAFTEVLQDTPGNYVRRLRLHRIRRDLTSKTNADSLISSIAARWGIREAGRMAGWYVDLFGEYPTDTREHHLMLHRESILSR